MAEAVHVNRGRPTLSYARSGTATASDRASPALRKALRNLLAYLEESLQDSVIQRVQGRFLCLKTKGIPVSLTGKAEPLRYRRRHEKDVVNRNICLSAPQQPYSFEDY